MLAIGISVNIVLYAFVNASVATGLFPVTGLPMPMISYGGSGLLINMMMIGILLNISQAKRSISGGINWRSFSFGYNKIIIAGGGTGGHLFPAIAIGEEIKDRFPKLKFILSDLNLV